MTDREAKRTDPAVGVQRTMSAIEGIVRILGPLESDERQRAIQGALVVLGEKITKLSSGASGSDSEPDAGSGLTVSSRARVWLRQNNLSDDQVAQVFDVSGDVAEVIAAGVLGKNNSEKTIKSYVLAGLASLLSSGEPAFTDKAARELCESLGCYDGTNHAKYMKDKGNYFLGDKEKGWKLTAPGLKYGAGIVKELAGAVDA